jgi:GYF domain 2
MDAIYLVIDGQSKGPFTQAQARDMLAKGEVTSETLAWYDGLPEWKPAGQLLGAAAAAAPVPPTPSASPVSAPATASPVTPGAFTKDELRHIAKSQNMLMWAVLAGFVAFFIAHIPLLGLPLVLAIVAFQIYALYTLGTALRLPLVWLMCVGMFVPCVSLIILVVVSAKASTILKAAGVRVGIMGGNADDIKD